MHEIDLRRTDLNLLVVLDVLLQERSVTRAAKRLFRSQSAVSHALGRLREQLHDPLLVKVGGEMRPTPRAEQLAPELARLLVSIERVLGEDRAFAPACSRRLFTLVAPDFVAGVFPRLVDAMSVEAPASNVELVQARRGMFRDVADGRYDLAVAPVHGGAIDGLRSARLASLEWAVFARKGHPAAASWSAAAWASYPHIRVRTMPGSMGPVDAASRSVGLSRKSGPYVPHFMLGPQLLAGTDLLMTVPRAALAGVADAFGLIVLPCPVALEPIQFALYWSAQLDRDPAIVWFRETVARMMCPGTLDM